MPLDYSSVRRQYDLLYGAGVTHKSMPEWAAEMNNLTSSNIYDRGLHDNWWVRVSNWADENVFHPVADVTTAPLGAAIGEAFGNAELGRDVGRSLPRMLAETAPLAIPYVGPFVVGGLMGAHTYADTGSGKAALISGVTGAALPFAGRFGGVAAARAFGTAERVAAGEFATETATGKTIGSFSGGWLPKEGSETAFKLATLGGSQAAQIATNEASMYGQAKVLGGEFDPLSPEFLATQIPFTLFDATHAIRSRPVSAKAMETSRIVPEKPVARERILPPSNLEQEAQREALFVRLQDVLSNDAASPEERQAALAVAIQGTTDTPTVIALKKKAAAPTTEVTVTGWGKQQENGSWKLVVDPERSSGVEVPEHGNVFVNDQNAVKNPDGSVSIRTTLDKVNGKVIYPLKGEEVRPNPNQPTLPVQKNGLAPDETRVFEKVGIKPTEVPEQNVPLRPIAHQIEQVEQNLSTAKEKIATVPKSAEEVASLIEPNPLARKSEEGYIPTVDVVRQAQQLVGKKEFQRRAQARMEGMQEPGTEAIALERAARLIVAEHQIKTSVEEGHTPTQAVESVRLQIHTPIVDTSLEETNVLKAKAEKVISVVGGAYSPEKPQAQYGKAVRDENGENFKTRGLAEAHRDADPELADYTVRDAGRGKGFYLAKQINKEVSLEGTDLEKVEAGNAALVQPIDARPDVSMDDVINRLDQMSKHVDVADELIGNDDIGQTLKELKFVREFMQKRRAGEDVKLDPEMAKVVAKVTMATGEWNSRFRSWDMGSTVPHDPVLVEQMQIPTKGIRGGLDWFVNHPKSGPMGEFVGGLLKAADANGMSLDGVDFIYDPRYGWSYEKNGRNGRPEITYPSLPSSENQAFIWANKAAHEVAHHFGAGILERADPQAVRFRATLNRVIETLERNENLPKKVRDAVSMSKKEGWYETFKRQESDPQELYDKFVKIAGEENRKWFGTFYAMHNEHELFANMFEDGDLVRLLSETKMPKTVGQTVLQWFSQAWNRLFHNGNPGQDNALHEILTKYEDFLSGPKVTDGPSLYNGRDYLRDALIAKGVRPEGLSSRIDTIEKLYSTGDLSHSLEGFEREAQAGTLPATTERGPVNEGFRNALLTGTPSDVYQSIKSLLAVEVPTHEELWARIRQDVVIARDLRNNIEKGYVPGSLSESSAKLGESFKLINAMKNGLAKQQNAIVHWNDLQNFTTEGFEDTLAAQLVQRRLPAPPDPTPNSDVAQGLLALGNEVAEVRRQTALAELSGKPMAPGLLQRWIGLTQHVKKLFPAVRPLMDNVRLQFAKQHEDNRTLKLVYDGYNPETRELDKTVRQRNIRIATTPALEKAASNMRRWGNIWEQAGEEWDYSRPEIQDILSKFNAKDRQALIDEANNGRARYHTWVNLIVPGKLSELNTANTAKVIAAHEVGILPEQARELSGQIYGALAAIQDPAQAVGGQEMLRQISTKMQPETFLAAIKYSQDMVAQGNKDLELMRSRPSYAPEQRYDADHLVMQGPKGQAFRAPGDRKSLEKLRKEKEAQGYTFLDYIPKSTTDTPVGIRSDFLDAMRESDLLRQNRLDSALNTAPPEIKALVMADAQRVSQYEAITNSFKPLPRVTRNFVEGREYINMLHNEDEFYSRSLNWYRHQITRANASLDMMHPDVAGNRVLKEYAQQHVDNALSPDNPFFRKLIKTVYFQRLAFSLGNSLLEAVQNLGTGMQAVIAETGSVTDAFKLWGSAIKNITMKGSRSADVQWMFDRAEALGLRRITTFRDIHDPDSEGAHFILSKNPLVKGANALQAGATKWATFFQRWNDNIGLSAGFELGLSKGMSRDEAFNFAWDLKERGLYTGGKSQRPVELWGIKTKPVPQMLSALQTYTLGWFSQMATDFRIGFRGEGEGLTETQRVGSRKAFLYGLAAQATLAGALGLPGVGQGLSLLKQVTGLDLKGQLRASLASLFDEDTENGGILTNLALRGALAGTTPIDPSNRAAISFPFVGVDPYKGFDISQLLGAPGASVSDAIKGTLAAMKGDVNGFQKLLPSVLKAPLQLLQGEGDVRDARGGLLQTLTPAERFLTAIGLPSSRIQAARDTAEAVKNLNDQATREREKLVDDLAATYRKQGPTLGQQKLVAYLQDHPQEDGASLVRSIATRVRRQTLPYDYRRDLSPNVDLHGLGSRIPSTETVGRQIEYDVQKNLGLRPRFNLRADLNAVTVDQLMDTNPYLSRSKALRQASEKLRGPRRNNLLNFQQPQSLFQE